MEEIVDNLGIGEFSLPLPPHHSPPALRQSANKEKAADFSAAFLNSVAEGESAYLEYRKAQDHPFNDCFKKIFLFFCPVTSEAVSMIAE